jgi:ubiquinone biosynthesis protein COQ9
LTTPETLAADDLTLEELRLVLAPRIAGAAVFDGWSKAAIDAAADETGTAPALARYAFEGGQMAMIAAWSQAITARMTEALAPEALAALPIRERIRTLVQFRLDAIAGQEEALRRALTIMAMPQNAAQALRLGWASADAMWRLAGDTATDYNHYTKRAILAGVYAATLAVYPNDQSEGKAETRAFLDRRIEGIIRFEKAKAKLALPKGEAVFSPVRFLGRLRYPAR